MENLGNHQVFRRIEYERNKYKPLKQLYKSIKNYDLSKCYNPWIEDNGMFNN